MRETSWQCMLVLLLCIALHERMFHIGYIWSLRQNGAEVEAAAAATEDGHTLRRRSKQRLVVLYGKSC